MTEPTISAPQFFEVFPSAEKARAYIESRCWPDGAVCPSCGESRRITTRKDGFYRCNACKSDFTFRTGTIFERSHIPLHKWLYAMYLLSTDCNGISSIRLGKQLGITQKSAWFMLKRLREACGKQLTKIGGKESTGKHGGKKRKAGRMHGVGDETLVHAKSGETST
ncbi:MAG: hypothetical protein DDT25_00603 [Chloroflexi bacterium]|nr:hypothetical protein [Chloroflexota bacterium]